MAAMSISTLFLHDGASQSAVFFLGLYMMAVGAGGIKPCVSSFGADQFDDSVPAERLKDSFFNWFFFAIYIGSFVSGTVVVWVQDHYGWVIGLWIPTMFIAMAIASFLSGSSSYRVQKPQGSPILRVLQVIVAAVRKWNVRVPQWRMAIDCSTHQCSGGFVKISKGHYFSQAQSFAEYFGNSLSRFLDKAAVVSSTEKLSGSDPWRLCTVTQVEELKVIVGMLPIWATGIVFFAVLAQFSSTFLEQGRTMDKQVGAFAIPAASLASFDAVSIIVWVPVYDRVLVPAAQRLTGSDRGLSELQRFGAGLLLSVLVMVAAAAGGGRARRRRRGADEHPVAGAAVLLGRRQRGVRVRGAGGVLLQRGSGGGAEPELGAGAADGGAGELPELAGGECGVLPHHAGRRRAGVDTRRPQRRDGN